MRKGTKVTDQQGKVGKVVEHNGDRTVVLFDGRQKTTAVKTHTLTLDADK